jgi:hypothetical protein
VRGSRFYSPKASHLRKGRRLSCGFESEKEEGELAVGKSWRKKKGRWKETLTGGSHMSATRRGNGRALAWRAAVAGLGPRGRRGRGTGPRPRQPKRAENQVNSISLPFFFFFPIFQIHFSNDFQIKFEFNLNHSIQNFKCSSMNAQSCFYPYI